MKQEQETEFTVESSLRLINETIDSSRHAVVRNSGLYFVLWGSLLLLFSLAIYLLWRFTGTPAWNYLWFAMPVAGYLFEAILKRYAVAVPSSFITNILGWIWAAFGAFAILSSVLCLTLVQTNLTLLIILLFGFSETICGIVLKNWPIIICGALTGLGGAVAAAFFAESAGQMLLFVLAGVILTLTGIFIRCLKK